MTRKFTGFEGRLIWLAETETTQALWKAVMGQDDNPSVFKDDNLPVENVSWDDCQEFIKKLNEAAKAEGFRFSLPSEAHWEYACRAGTTTRYSWGDYWDSSKAKGDKKFKPNPAGSYAYSNNWGLKDMHGNVWEWCEDRYVKYLTGPATDPKGPDSGSSRVIRGGSWYRDDNRGCRSAVRDVYPASKGAPDIGFRLELGDNK